MNEHDQESLEGNLGLETVAIVERLALHAWPGLEVAALDGWLLRHAAGITRRANSVWPNEMIHVASLEKNVAHVEEYYRTRELPARFQICPAAQPAELDAFLAQRGYQAVARTAVQTTNLDEMLARFDDAQATSAGPTVEMTSQPDAGWWQCYAEADEVAPSSVAGRKAICAQIDQKTAYAVVYRQGEAIAVGSAIAEAGWLGFFNVATLAKSRRLGAALVVMQALGNWGKVNGATDAYLQVMANNEPAKKLYARLGFVTGYYYQYREQVSGQADEST